MADDRVIRVKIDGSAAKQGGEVVAVSLRDIATAAVSVAGSLKILDAVVGKMIGSLNEMVSAAAESERVFKQLEQAVKATGGSAGYSAAQMADMANALSRVSTYSDEAIGSAEAVLARFTKIGKDVFPQAVQAVLNLGAAMGRDLTSAALAVGRALQEPESGLAGLSRAGIQFSNDEREAIKALVEFGHQAEAQAVILDRIKQGYDGASSAARDTFSGAVDALKVSISELYETAGNQLIPVLRNLAETLNGLARDQAVIAFFKDLGTEIGTVVSVLSTVTNLFSTAFKYWQSAAPGVAQGLKAIFTPLAAFHDMFSGGNDKTMDFSADIKHWADAAEQAGPPLSAFYLEQGDNLKKQAEAQKEAEKAAAAYQKRMDELADNAAAKWLKPLKDFASEGSKLNDFLRDETVGKTAQWRIEQIVKAMHAQEQADKAQEEAIDRLNKKQAAYFNQELEHMAKLAASWKHYVEEPGVQAWESTKDAAETAIADMVTGGKVDFESLFREIVAMWIKALEEMLVRWLAMKAAMKSYELADSGTSSGGNGGIMSVASYAISKYFSSGGSSPGGGSSSAGWAVAAFAAVIGTFFAMQNASKASASSFARLNVIWVGITQSLKAVNDTVTVGADEMDRLAAKVNPMLRATNELVAGLGGMITGFDGVLQIDRTGRSKKTKYWVEYANGLTKQFGNDAEAAMEFATIQAVKQSKIQGLDPIVAAAIKSSVAEKLDDFNKQIAAALEIANLGGSSAEGEVKSAFSSIEQHMAALRDALVQLNLPAAEAAQGFQNIAAAEADQLNALRDSITGRKKSAEEEYQDQLKKAQIFNAELALRKADLQARIVDLEAQMDALQASRSLASGHSAVADSIGGTTARVLEYAQALDPLSASIQAQIDAIRALLNNLPKDISPDEIVPPGKGGGRGNAGRSNKDQLNDFFYQHALDRMGPAERALAELKKEYDDAAKLAGKDKDALAKLNKERAEEEKLIRQQTRQAVRMDVTRFLGKGGDVGGQILDIQSQAQALGKELQDALKSGSISAVEFANKMKLVADQAKALQAQAITNAANQIILDLYDYLGMEKEAAEMRHTLAVADLLLKQQELQASLQMASLTEAQRATITGILGKLGDLIGKVINDPNYGAGGSGSGNGVPITHATGGGYQGYLDQQDALAKLIEEFNKAIDAVRAFRESLKLDSNLSPLTPEQRLSEAQSQFQALAQKALTGDVTSINAIPDAARAFLEIARGFFASSDGYQQIFNYVDSILQQILNLQVPHMAAGGVVDRPTFALIGEAGPEAVTPIGRSSAWHANQMQMVELQRQAIIEQRRYYRKLDRHLEREPIRRKGGR